METSDFVGECKGGDRVGGTLTLHSVLLLNKFKRKNKKQENKINKYTKRIAQDSALVRFGLISLYIQGDPEKTQQKSIIQYIFITSLR